MCRLHSCYQAHTDTERSVEEKFKFGSTERQIIIFEQSCDEFAKMPSGL